MFDGVLTPFLVVGLIALTMGLLAWLVAFPFLTGEHKAEKRIEAVAKSKANRAGSRQEATTDRRKQVTEQLKYADQKKAAKNKVTLKTKLIRAGLAATPQQFHIASIIMGVVGFVVCFVAGLNIMTDALVGFAAGMGVPRWIVGFLAKRRQKKFSHEFPNAIDVIVRGVQTGLPLNECLNIIARESQQPVKGEFADFVERQRLGIATLECFDRMMESIPLPEVNFFAIVVAIQQGSGGNLAEALSNLSGVIRSRKMLAAKVQALAGEAKATAYILGATPFVVAGMVYAVAPSFINPLFSEPLGHVFLGVAAVMMTVGIIIMRQLINFKY